MTAPIRSYREFVTQRAAAGLRDHEIARELNVSVDTLLSLAEQWHIDVRLGMPAVFYEVRAKAKKRKRRAR